VLYLSTYPYRAPEPSWRFHRDRRRLRPQSWWPRLDLCPRGGPRAGSTQSTRPRRWPCAVGGVRAARPSREAPGPPSS